MSKLYSYQYNNIPNIFCREDYLINKIDVIFYLIFVNLILQSATFGLTGSLSLLRNN